MLALISLGQLLCSAAWFAYHCYAVFKIPVAKSEYCTSCTVIEKSIDEFFNTMKNNALFKAV
jgi:hypothetical protein